MFLFKEFALAKANAVFPGTGAAKRQALRNDFSVQRPGLFQRGLVIIRKQDQAMEIAIADMADNAACQSRYVSVEKLDKNPTL